MPDKELEQSAPIERIPGVETEAEKLEREQLEMIEEALRMNF